MATGFLGGMAGCAMIGQSMINVKSGGRTRLSTLSVVAKFAAHHIEAELVGLNEDSALLHGRTSGHLLSSH